MNTFAERLKYAMEQADLKQSALSEQAGISKAAISQYLSGKNTPNQERIKALADVTGVTFDFLMGYGAAPVTDAPPPVKKISVKEAARCMGKSDQFVRIGLQRGLLPFGNAVPGTGNNWNYYINKALKLGVQALLRSQMISDFNKYSEKGYAPIYARESFENCWKQYHSLGVNGVMNDLHKKFLELPTEAPDE